MENKKYQLVQANYTYWKDDVPPTQMEAFMTQAFLIHSAAERVSGFVWRYSSDELIDQEVTKIFGSPKAIFNMTVWNTLEDLKNFSFKGNHLDAMKKGDQWFASDKPKGSILWWKEKGQLPTVSEAKKKFEHFDSHGPSIEAFHFSCVIPMEKMIEHDSHV